MNMNLSPVFIHQFHNRIERVLHRKGNFTGPVLEMTVIVDHSVSAGVVQEGVPALLRCLKQHSEVFRNVRLNITDWLEDTRIENRVVPMMTVLVSGFFESYEQICNEKKTEALYQYLKLYHARSKLILLVTDGRHRPEDEKAAEEALKPFLGKKLVSVLVREDGMELG